MSREQLKTFKTWWLLQVTGTRLKGDEFLKPFVADAKKNEYIGLFGEPINPPTYREALRSIYPGIPEPMLCDMGFLHTDYTT